MTRKKVKLAFIVNDAARKATYKKRKKGLLKKVDELSTLCGIEACAIVYGPYEPQPEIWPSPWGVQKVLSKFKTMPEMEQAKKMVNQETFMKQRVMKATEQVKKQRKDNREKEFTMLMFECLGAGNINALNNLPLVDLNDLSWLIDHNLKEVGRKLEAVEINNNNDTNNVFGQIQSQTMTTQNYFQLQMAPPPPLQAPQVPPQAQPQQAMFQNGEIATMGLGHVEMGMGNNGDIVQREWLMGMMNGNGGETTPFGHVGNL